MSEARRPRLVPVLDVMGGLVVRAVGGLRDTYRPVASALTAATHPVNVALALLARTGAAELYVADLDAIRGGAGVSEGVSRLFREFRQPPVTFWADVGLNDRRPPELLSAYENVRPVIALETGAGPSHLADAVARFGPHPVAASIDLKGGTLLGKWADWGAAHDGDALAVARTAVRAGARALIVLDLARVGRDTGVGTEPLLSAIRAEFPDLDLIAGGGVRSWADIDELGAAGANGVLVASALHDGTLTVR